MLRSPARRWIESVGMTPLINLSSLSPNPSVEIYAKAEFLNPSGSVKDRIVQHIFDRAEASGDLKPGGTVVAASSGNTAASVAMFAAIRGYKSIVITNSKTSKEKLDALYAYGAEVMLTRSGVAADHPDHYQNIELKLCQENDSFFSVNQYENPLNPEAYYHTLGPEIWEQTGGKVDCFIAAASTGGTITGTARYLKDQKPSLQALMPDPLGSIFFDYYKSGKIGKTGSFQVEGVGKDSIPGALDFNVVDELVQFSDQQAFDMCHRLAHEEGLLVGGSAGANVWAAVDLAGRVEVPPGDTHTIVTLLPDSGVKYLSKIFNEDWMAEYVTTFDKDEFTNQRYARTEQQQQLVEVDLEVLSSTTRSE